MARRNSNSRVLLAIFLFSSLAAAADLRVGIIGLDTSHAVEFTKLLNDPQNPAHINGARVVAAFAGGSPDIQSSIDRVPQYTATLRDQWHVEIVSTIAALLPKVDAVLLLSVDGRPHLEQARPVIAAHKPVFIDKPLAASLKDAREIFRLCSEARVPCFSASALRFYPGVQAVKTDAGEIYGVDAFAPAALEPHHPDLYWYEIHGVEILYSIMGAGCQWVERTFTENQDLIKAQWKDGRVISLRGTRNGKHEYGALVFGSKGVKQSAPVEGALYRGLVSEIVRFFETGVPPVPAAETLEMFTFMDAAQLSRQRGGARVELREVP